MRRDVDVGQGGNSRRSLAPCASANQQPAKGVGFPHPAGRYRPGGCTFSSPGCRICTGMERFLIRGREFILRGVRWLYVRSPANQRSASMWWKIEFIHTAITRGSICYLTFSVYFLTMASQTGCEIMNSEVASSILTVFPVERKKGIFSRSRTRKTQTASKQR